MQNIKHLLFDLDHTLWDYDKASYITLKEYYESAKIASQKISFNTFFDTFTKVNSQLWDEYNFGTLTKEELHDRRFTKIFDILKINHLSPDEASKYFIAHCSSKPYLQPHTIEVLTFLKHKYMLHIVSNGFDETQTRKLQHTKIDNFFELVVTSENSKARKPSPQIFQYTLEQIDAKKEECLMVGDNLLTDIKGAQDFGIKAIHYHVHNTVVTDPTVVPDFTITSLLSLKKIL